MTQDQEPSVTHAFFPDFSGGVGDFLGGSLHLLRICQKNRVPFYMDFRHHEFGSFLKQPSAYPLEFATQEILNLGIKHRFRFDKMEHEIERLIKKCRKPLFLASFFVKGLHDCISAPDKILRWQEEVHLTEDEKKFLQERLSFTSIVESSYHRFLEHHSLTEKTYDIVHFRHGDRELLKSQGLTVNMLSYIDEFDIDYPSCLMRLEELSEKAQNPKVVLSDSNTFKKYLRENAASKRIVSPTFSSHSSQKPGLFAFSEHKISSRNEWNLDIALDMRIIQGAKSAIGFSNYPWGSNFLFWLCKIFDLPLTKQPLGKMLQKANIKKRTLPWLFKRK